MSGCLYTLLNNSFVLRLQILQAFCWAQGNRAYHLKHAWKIKVAFSWQLYSLYLSSVFIKPYSDVSLTAVHHIVFSCSVHSFQQEFCWIRVCGMPGPVTPVCMRDVSCTHDVLHKQGQPALAELCACTRDGSVLEQNLQEKIY